MKKNINREYLLENYANFIAANELNLISLGPDFNSEYYDESKFIDFISSIGPEERTFLKSNLADLMDEYRLLKDGLIDDIDVVNATKNLYRELSVDIKTLTLEFNEKIDSEIKSGLKPKSAIYAKQLREKAEESAALSNEMTNLEKEKKELMGTFKALNYKCQIAAKLNSFLEYINKE